MSKTLRVPAGVIIGRQRWGGRFVTRDQLINLAAVTDAAGLRAIERLAEREATKAARTHQRAADRYVEDPRRYLDRRTLAQQLQQEWERVVNAAKEFQAAMPQIARKPTAKRPRKRQQARPAVAKRHKPQQAVEWEVGFKYRAEARSRRSSDVDVNLRVRRVDGKPFTVAQARKVLNHIRRTQETPDAYLVAGVDWKRPYAGTGWRHGNVTDMESFWAPMYSRDREPGAWELHSQDFRYGAIKGMEDDDND